MLTVRNCAQQVFKDWGWCLKCTIWKTSMGVWVLQPQKFNIGWKGGNPSKWWHYLLDTISSGTIINDSRGR